MFNSLPGGNFQKKRKQFFKTNGCVIENEAKDEIEGGENEGKQKTNKKPHTHNKTTTTTKQ